MNLTVVSLICFAGMAMILAAVGLLLRDLFASGKNLNQRAKLGRLPLAREHVAPANLAQSLDHGLDKLVVESGVHWTTLAVVLGLISSGLLAGGLLWIWLENPVASGVAAVIGMVAPVPILFFHRSSRLRKIRGQFADSLDLMARAVRAGESFDQALELAGDRGPQPLALELRRCSGHLQMGLSIPAAMRSLLYRLQMMEIRIFATTLSVHREGGGNLSRTLERMATVVRDRLNYQRQLRAATSAGRFAATIISMAGPMLFAFMFIFYPEYGNKLVTIPLGQSLLTLAVVLEIIGLIWVYRMLRSEY